MPYLLKAKIRTYMLIVILVILLVGLFLLEFSSVKVRNDYYQEQLAAAQLMMQAVKEIRNYRLNNGIDINKELDVNETGLIGEEFTPLTTTLGNLEAKRSTTNPDFAALMVKFFQQIGLKKGDNIAIGASGSFPALIIATLSAASVMELEPIIIYSIGASMYGANLPEFSFIKILSILQGKGIFPYQITAVSMGGERDQAEKMFFPDSQEIIKGLAQSSGQIFINEETLIASIKRRLEIYQSNSQKQGIACFVNIGGSAANFGTTALSLSFPNGLVIRELKIPFQEERGLIFEYAALGIPVINLLNIRDLALKQGLPIDPVPLPTPGQAGVYFQTVYHKSLALMILILIAIMIYFARQEN